MQNLTSKILCSTAMITLLSMSFNPLYALDASFDSETTSNPYHKRAIGDPITNEFPINQNKTVDQLNPSVTRLTNGNVFATWYSYQSVTSSYEISGRIYSPQGTPINNEFSINQNKTGIQRYPSVTSLTNGNVLVVWQGDQAGSDDTYGRVISPQGTAISNEFGINQNTTGFQGFASATGLANGNVFVAWYGNPNGNYDIFGRVFSPQGAAVTNEFTINQNTTGGQYIPSLVNLPNGNVFTAWFGDQTGNFDIYGRVFSPQGTPTSNEFGINQNTSGNQGNPSLVSLSTGNVFAAWLSDQTGNYNIYGRIISPQGTAVSNEFAINQNTTGDQINPSAGGLSDGDVFVTWCGNQTGDYDISGRIFSPQGTASSNEFGINQNTTGKQQYPSVAGLANGDAFVAWYGDQTGNNDVYGRIMQASPSTSSSNRLTPPMWVMPVKVVIGGFKDLWNFATTKSPSLPVQPLQRTAHYVKSWFSSQAWGEYFDSMERSVLDYSKSVVTETPSYRSAYFGSKANVPFMSMSGSYNSTIGTGFLPHSVVSGAIGR